MAIPKGEAGPLDTTVLFVDLVGSSEFASVLGLREYAEYLNSFKEVCAEQAKHFFEEVHQGKFEEGADYSVQSIGDEFAVFVHTGRPANDIYQLVCLAISLKCAWLGSPKNQERVESGMSTTNIACGIHFGTVWGDRTGSGNGYDLCGFAINLAKRVETASRGGSRFQIFLSDAAYKRIARKLRNLIVGPRTAIPMKGIVVPVAVHEIEDSFVDPFKRLAAPFGESFQEVAHSAPASNSTDQWIYSCLLVWEESKNGRVTDESYELCLEILQLAPDNAVALYYAAQGAVERGDAETARLYLEDLTGRWPYLGDGWLELARVYDRLERKQEAQTAALQARRFGIPEQEAPLPKEVES